MKGAGAPYSKKPFRKGPFRKRRVARSNKNPSSNKNPATVGTLMAGSFPNLAIRAKLREYRLKKLWPAAVGEGISKRARPLRLIGDTLYCVVSSSAWMTELTYQKPALIEKLKGAAGEKGLREIVFKPGTIPSEPAAEKPSPAQRRAISREEKEFIEKTVAGIKDSSLKALLRRVMEKGHGG